MEKAAELRQRGEHEWAKIITAVAEGKRGCLLELRTALERDGQADQAALVDQLITRIQARFDSWRVN